MQCNDNFGQTDYENLSIIIIIVVVVVVVVDDDDQQRVFFVHSGRPLSKTSRTAFRKVKEEVCITNI